MSETLGAWRIKQKDYHSLIQKSGHHAAQMRSHQKQKEEVDARIDTLVKKISELESHFTKKDLEAIQEQTSPVKLVGGDNNESKESTVIDGDLKPVGEPEIQVV